MTTKSQHSLGNIEGEATANMLTGVVKGAVSLIPGLGPVMSEVLGTLIPNSRMQRVVAYLQYIQTHLPDEVLEKIKSIPEKIEFFEEGMLAAGLTPGKSKLSKIANAVANGLKKDEFIADHESAILRVVTGLGEAEAIILEYYGLGENISTWVREQFHLKHPEIWPAYPSLNRKKSPTPEEIKENRELLKQYNQKHSYLRSYTRNLASQALLTPSYNDSNFRHLIDEAKTDTDALENVMKSLADPKYKITLFGAEVLRAIKMPNLTSTAHKVVNQDANE